MDIKFRPATEGEEHRHYDSKYAGLFKALQDGPQILEWDNQGDSMERVRSRLYMAAKYAKISISVRTFNERALFISLVERKS